MAFTSVGLKHPWLREMGRVRHYYRAGFAREHISEVAELWKLRKNLAESRDGRDVCWLEHENETEPLVTIRIATKDRAELLVERALAAARRQSYERVEILVVGDHCDDATGEALRKVADPRIRYINLGAQGRYPQRPIDRWRVAGSKPMNAGLLLASGTWMAPCDDDDEFTDDHVETLLTHCKRERLEFAWGKAVISPGEPNEKVVGSPDRARGTIVHGALIYSMGLDFFQYSTTCHRMLETFDWNLWRRMMLAGVRMGFVDALTYRYWPSATNAPTAPAGPTLGS